MGGEIIRKEVLDLLKEWCEWNGEDLERYVNEVLLIDLKYLAEELVAKAPKAKEFQKRAERLLEVLGGYRDE